MTENSLPTRSNRPGTETKRKKRGVALFIRDLLVIFVVALLISFLIKTFLVRSFYIPSGSMETTLLINDRIIVNQLEPKLIPVERGDVVVFRDPGGWLLPQAPLEQNAVIAAVDWVMAAVGLSAPDSNDHLIKRVIGLPGDHVTCCNPLGQMSVNDVPLSEPYVSLPTGETSVSQDDFDIVVPDGSLWVMGDNRYNSKDSRYNTETPGKGFVPIDNVVGRALVISWPTARWSWLDDYSEVFQGVSTETR
ncbi:signal peptidase I [Cryobacterium sp. TMT2-18-3]|uniref:signal peptidase I n=1 Tax=unclassified Cryobacterium TaxID=2649013 RepID=UPI00106996F3|nr:MULTISPECIES: signal peptidase I [unclassified Cryobacterium]TFC28965.1 signal peptidase I [Cryobacterium sp. TMT2-18-2]TFC38450.1 signal peptidase I [Cryobacterium sp. TMT2-42-4]TFC60188.1 signal peptidase I [Cryobacterium sp. TMT2-15-1]TFC61048.1 signal peptidase I [Cryobacterium sp. TMT2-18-3]